MGVANLGRQKLFCVDQEEDFWVAVQAVRGNFTGVVSSALSSLKLGKKECHSVILHNPCV